MKHSIATTFLALGGAWMLASTSNAQLPTVYSPGDALVGFRQVGNNNSVVIDIGPMTNFTTPMVFAINAGATLTAQYGTGWQSNANVFFSLAATSSSTNTNYVTSPSYLLGPDAGPAVVWSRLTNTNSTIFRNKINFLGNEFTSAGQVEPKTDPNAYANYMPGGTTDAGHANGNLAWGFFNPTSEGNFGQTTAGVSLDYIQLVPGSGPGTDLGNFRLSADGNLLTFTPAVVPEPSTYAAMVALGALALVAFQMNKAPKSSTKELSA